jgi:hypothetical protein
VKPDFPAIRGTAAFLPEYLRARCKFHRLCLPAVQPFDLQELKAVGRHGFELCGGANGSVVTPSNVRLMTFFFA